MKRHTGSVIYKASRQPAPVWRVLGRTASGKPSVTGAKQTKNSLRDLVRGQLEKSITTMQSVMADESIAESLVHVAKLTAASMRKGGKLLVAGNGGSAAESQHLVAEFVSRLTVDRPALRAIALTVDTSILTAVGNDYSYDQVFERQIEALGQPGDVFLAISTSGKSTNLVKALRLAGKMGLITAGLTGNGGGAMRNACDHIMIVPSQITMNIQEAHLALEHIFCMVVERLYFGTTLESNAGPPAGQG